MDRRRSVMSNSVDHLPEAQETWAHAIRRRVSQSEDVKTGAHALRYLARRLDRSVSNFAAANGIHRQEVRV